MAAELMLINPRRRRRSRRKARVTHARRNPRRRRSRRLSALQEKYFGKRTHARRNPRRRRYRSRIGKAAFGHGPRRRKYTLMRRNPTSLSSNPVGFVSSTIVPAAVGAIGGVGVNYIFDNYAPVSLQTGILNPLSRLGLAALLGIGVGMVTDNRTGAMVAAGAMTVTAYDMINNYMNGTGVFQTSSSQGQQFGRIMRRLNGRGMGRIMNRRASLGYMNPARQMGRFVSK